MLWWIETHFVFTHAPCGWLFACSRLHLFTLICFIVIYLCIYFVFYFFHNLDPMREDMCMSTALEHTLALSPLSLSILNLWPNSRHPPPSWCPLTHRSASPLQTPKCKDGAAEAERPGEHACRPSQGKRKGCLCICQAWWPLRHAARVNQVR